jgi:hypothetical protein
MIVGREYVVDHPRAGQFRGIVEAVAEQHVDGNLYEWVTIRSLTPGARTVAYRQELPVGGTVQLLSCQGTWRNPHKPPKEV